MFPQPFSDNLVHVRPLTPQSVTHDHDEDGCDDEDSDDKKSDRRSDEEPNIWDLKFPLLFQLPKQY